jgi:hypothetical protein
VFLLFQNRRIGKKQTNKQKQNGFPTGGPETASIPSTRASPVVMCYKKLI